LGKAYTYLRMKFALLIAGLSAVSAIGSCYGAYTDKTSCNANTTCAWNFACFKTNTTACGGDMMGCTGGSTCGAASMIVNPITCSKCMDLCNAKTDNSSCYAMAGCQGTGYCDDKPAMMMAGPCAGTSSSACTNEAGCYWIGFTVSDVCKGPPSGLMNSAMLTAGGMCVQCNGTASAVRGPVSRLQGQSCTFIKTGNYAANVTVTLTGFAAGKVDTNCPAIASMTPSPAQMTADVSALTTGLALSTYLIDPLSPAVCTAAPKSSDSSMLSPSLALLGLVGFLTRL